MLLSPAKLLVSKFKLWCSSDLILLSQNHKISLSLSPRVCLVVEQRNRGEQALIRSCKAYESLLMDKSQDPCNLEASGDDHCSSSSSSSSSTSSAYRLFDRQRSIYQIMGGGKAADVILWKQGHVSFGIIVVATIAWILFERSGLSFLSISSDVLLVLIVIQFLRANYAVLRNKQLRPLPELELSEEMVNNSAASFRVKINYMLLMAHDITLGKDFRLFFKVVVCLWLLSVIGSFFSFFTLAYVGTIMSITVPALYNKYEEHVDRYAGLVHKKFSKHYRIVDETVISRLPRSLSRDKDA